MDDKLLLIVKTAVPLAFNAALQMMLFVWFTNKAKDIRKNVLAARRTFR
jgi:hypothetical protein